jgi:type I restriction enzyme, S subunit
MKWEKVKLHNVIDKIIGGGTPSKSNPNYWEGDIPWCSVKDMADGKFKIDDTVDKISLDGLQNSSSNLIPSGTVIMATRMGLGRVFISQIDMAINQDLKAILPNNKIDNTFLLWSLANKANEIESLGVGATVKGIRLEVLKEIQISLPPLPTQQRIAAILSGYDDKIENNLKRIKLLEEQAVTKYKEIMKNEQTVEGKVLDLAEVKSGFAFKGSDWTNEGFPVIKIRNIDNNDIDLLNCSLIPENVAENAYKFKLNQGDLLIAMTGATVGKIGMMPKTDKDYYLNQRVGIFRPKINFSEFFLFCFFNQEYAKTAINNLASGAAQPNISGGQIESIKLFYPKKEIIFSFGEYVKGCFELIWNLKQENAQLRSARDLLLPRLMNIFKICHFCISFLYENIGLKPNATTSVAAMRLLRNMSLTSRIAADDLVANGFNCWCSLRQIFYLIMRK